MLHLRSRRIGLLAASLALIFVAAASSFLTYRIVTERSAAGIAGGISREHLEKMGKIYSIIRDKYIEPTDDRAVIEGSYRGMVASLDDPYSVYLDARSFADMTVQATGTYDGIGVYLAARDGRVTVIAPIKGGPAEKAGIRAGDRIVKVDGLDVAGMHVDDVVSRIKGKEGTSVQLYIEREGASEPLKIEIVREEVRIIPVEWTMLPNGAGYVRITIFNENTTSALEEALAEFRTKHAKGVILDLRQNPGMLLDQCVRATEMFVPAGPIVHVVERSGKRETLSSTGKGLGLPLVVLVDGGSASASEIMAGAIQDRDAGKLVGTRTFGKGLVQAIIDLEDGTAVKITSARYETPNGRTIHGIGLSPDVYSELRDGETPMAPWEGLDSQVLKAIEVLESLKKGGA